MASMKGLQQNKVQKYQSCQIGKSSYRQIHPLRWSFLIWTFVLSIPFQTGYAGHPSLSNRVASIHATGDSPGKGNAVENTSFPPVVVNPNITVRFANPTFDCNTDDYCVDAEFQSDLANQELFGMNVRFWFDDSVLEFVMFKNFVGGYGAVAPNPPVISTSGPAGPAWFNFVGGAEYVNGAVQLTNENLPPVYISTSGWTKLFTICFDVDDPNANVNSFCPSVVWDLEANPANGGFLPGSDGIVMTVVNPNGGTFPTYEHVDQYNWHYIGSGAAPYGEPIVETCSSINCAPTITCPANVTVACGASTLPPNTGTATATDLCNGDPTISYNDYISGGPCPDPSLISRTWTATDNCGNSSTCLQTITVGGTFCNLVVNSTGDSGTGTLRDAIACADPGDTITFATSLAGGNIVISSGKILLDKNLFIRSNLAPRLKISSTTNQGLFELAAGKTVEFKDIDIHSGPSSAGNSGAAFNNNGVLKLVGVKVYRHPSLPSNYYVIRNKPGSQLSLNGACFIEYN